MVAHKYESIDSFDKISYFLLILTSLFIIAIIFLVVLLPPPESYEISFYTAIPSTVWILLVLSLSLILSVFASNPPRRLWVCSLILCGVISILVILLPHLRGYYLFFTGDTLYHIGIISDIISSGSIAKRNIYPSLHLLATTLILISDLSIEGTVILLSLYMVITSLIIGVIVSRRLPLPKRGKLLTMGLLSIFMIGKVYYIFSPWAKSQWIFFYLILWFIFVGFVESRRNQFIILVIFVSSIPFHLFTSLSLLSLFIISILVKGSGEIIEKSISSVKITAMTLLIGTVSWLYWILSIERFTVVLRRSLISLLFPATGPRQSEVSENAEIIFRASPDLLDIFSAFIFRYGKPVLVIGFALFLILFGSLNRKNTNLEYKAWILFPLLLIWLLGTVTAFLPFPGFSVGRLYHIGFPLALIAIGYEIFYVINTKPKFTKIILIILVIILIISIPLTVATIYNGSGNKIPNEQILKSELSSTNWFVQYGEDTKVYNTGAKIQRLSAYSQGAEGRVLTFRPPPHFNWSESNIEANSSSSPYLIITPRDLQVYPTFYPEYEHDWDYKPEDFESVEQSTETEKIHSSGYVTIYRINTTKL